MNIYAVIFILGVQVNFIGWPGAGVEGMDSCFKGLKILKDVPELQTHYTCVELPEGKVPAVYDLSPEKQKLVDDWVAAQEVKGE